MMRFMLFYPLLFGVVGRYFLPAIARNSGFNITGNADFILAVLALMTPVIFGALIGFSILDDRDDHIIDSIKVTPLTFNQFMSFRLIVVYILSLISCIFVIWFSDVATLPWKDLLLISFLASLGAPITGLLINIFSQNKIEGFAIMKLLGIIVMLPIISLLFTDARELFFAIFPAFWPAKMISTLIRGEAQMFLSYNLYFWIGLVYVAIASLLAYKKFIRKVAS